MDMSFEADEAVSVPAALFVIVASDSRYSLLRVTSDADLVSRCVGEEDDGALGRMSLLSIELSITWPFVSSSLALNEAPFWYRTSSMDAVRLSSSASLANIVEFISGERQR